MSINQYDLINFNHDSEAFKKLFDHFFPSLCYFAERLIADKEEAEDLVLDLFTRVWTDKARFENIDSLKGYLYISTRNRCLNFLQARKKKELSKRELKYLSEDHFTAVLVDYELINAEIMQVIYQEVEQLPPHCRQVFKMIFYEGLPTAEIARRLGITSKTVLNQKLKALNALRTELLRKRLSLPLVLLYTIANSRIMA